MNSIARPFFLLSFVFYVSLSYAQIIYVDQSATGLNNGSSWSNAFTSLDSAFIKAKFTNTDTIKIAQGIYKPSLIPSGSSTNSRDAAFYLSASTIICGGYGNGGSDRNPSSHPTIFSGDIGIANDTTDNVFHVLVISGANCIINGVTIEDGNATGTDSLTAFASKIPRLNGGAIFCEQSNVELTSVIMKDNFAIAGGSCFFLSSTVSLNSSFFLNNYAYNEGGAIKSESSDCGILNCVFYQNIAEQYGGAIVNRNNGNFSMSHSTLVSNGCYFGEGGAVYNGKMHLSQIGNTLFTLNFEGLPTTTWAQGADIRDSLAITQAYYCLLQEYSSGTECRITQEAWLMNNANPYGADNILGTTDDGLKITPASLAFNAGYESNAPPDILGISRNSQLDIGAYETNACGNVVNRIIYVDSSATGLNTGNSWQNAYKELQSALNVASLGCVDSIKVAKGTYYPLNPPPNSNSPHNSFYLYSNISLLGGYSTGGGVRDAAQFTTTLAGDNSLIKHVIIIAEKENVLLDGFTITGGRADGAPLAVTIDAKSYPNDNGGGILVFNSKATINNCIIRNNSAASFGGGISAQGSQLKLFNSTVKSNQTYSFNFQLPSAGGIYITLSQAGSVISKSTFENNSTIYRGAGVYLYQAYNTVTIDSCTFINNHCSMNLGNADGGGAVATEEGSYLSINHSFFESNTGHQGGAVFCNYLTRNTFNACVFKNNSCTRDGGAVHIRGAYSTNLANCLFIQNNSPSNGGGLYVGETAGIYFCEFLKNSAVAGGGIYNASSLDIANTVFWKNKNSTSINASGADIEGPAQTSHNNLWQVYSSPGNGNLTGIEAAFVDTTNAIGPDNFWGTSDDGFTLKGNSPLFNTGSSSNYYPPFITSDIKGTNRIQCNAADIGAYEREECNIFTKHTVYVDSSAINGSKTGVDWANAFTDIQSAITAANLNTLDTIKIAKGTYNYTNILDISSNMVLMGGHPNGGGNVNYSLYPTILDGTNAGRIAQVIDRTNVTFEGLIFQKVTSANQGSAIYASNSSIKIKNVQIRNCSSQFGAVYLTNCTGDFINCAIYNNRGLVGAAGIVNISSPVKYVNCLFSNNYNQGFNAGAIQVNTPGLPSFINCTFFKNFAGNGGAIVSGDSTPIVRNCIFWSNKSSTALQAGYIRELGATNHFIANNISNCLFEFQPQGTVSNSFIAQYPAFADSSNVLGNDGMISTIDDGLILSSTSIAINKGNNTWLPNGDTTDITGNKRINSNIVDLGAYESSCNFSGVNVLVPVGSLQQDNTVQSTCGTLDYVQSPANPSQYIVMLDGNGNPLSPSSVTVDATNSLSHVSTDGIGDSTVLAYRMVSIVAPGTFTTNGGVKVRIYYNASEFQNLPLSFRSWFKHPAHTKQDVLADLTPGGLQNANYINPSSQGFENGISYVQFDSVSSFSTFGYLGKVIASPLPIIISTFKATKEASSGHIRLQWTTTSEKNNLRFEIERSFNGAEWSVIGSVKGHGTSNQVQTYVLIDSLPLAGMNYYRLRQFDIDGTVHYSRVESIKMEEVPIQWILSPNPANSFINIRCTYPQPLVAYEMFDVEGRQLIKGVKKNVTEFNIDVSEIKGGTYFLRVNSKVQKMIIVK